jgi:hypothetical protein
MPRWSLTADADIGAIDPRLTYLEIREDADHCMSRFSFAVLAVLLCAMPPRLDYKLEKRSWRANALRNGSVGGERTYRPLHPKVWVPRGFEKTSRDGARGPIHLRVVRTIRAPQAQDRGGCRDC